MIKRNREDQESSHDCVSFNNNECSALRLCARDGATATMAAQLTQYDHGECYSQR